MQYGQVYTSGIGPYLDASIYILYLYGMWAMYIFSGGG